MAPKWPDPGLPLARLYVVGPERIRAPEPALSLAMLAQNQVPPLEGAAGILGAVYYRLGRFTEAEEQLEKSSRITKGTHLVADLLFLAATCQRLNFQARAKESFQKASALLDQLPKRTEAADREELRQLREEIGRVEKLK